MPPPVTTSARIIRDADFEAMTTNGGERLKQIIQRAREAENLRVAPTLKARKEMSRILLDFIKARGRIVYGGYAINALISAKSKEDAIYDLDNESPDIEFYSPDAVIDARDICDLFHAKGYPYVRASEAMHAETYKVIVDLNPLCDITYAPKNIARAIPYVAIGGVKYAHPHFMLIDSLRILTDPLTSYWRLDKAFPRIYALQKHYPLIRPGGHAANLATAAPAAEPEVREAVAFALEFLRDGLPKNDGRTEEVAIMIGYAAFARFRRWASPSPSSDEDDTPRPIPLLEVVVTDYSKTVPRLFEAMRARFGGRGATVEYEEYQRFFDYAGRRGQIYVNRRPAVCVYHHNDRCTPVLPVARDGIESVTLRTATLSVTALYLMIAKMFYRTQVPFDARGQAVCDSLVYELYAMRSEYLASSKSRVDEDHPFQEFTSTCVGASVSTARKHKVETEYRRSRPHQFGMAYFTYEPANPGKNRSGEFKYMNSSGNVTRSAADRLYTPAEGLVPVEGAPAAQQQQQKVAPEAAEGTTAPEAEQDVSAPDPGDGNEQQKQKQTQRSPRRNRRGARPGRRRASRRGGRSTSQDGGGGPAVGGGGADEGGAVIEEGFLIV